MSTRTGWVGFFDILGYANLLQRNEPESIAQEVVPLLTGTHPEIIANIGKALEQLIATDMDNPQDARLVEDIRRLIGEMNWLLFSDTILISMPVVESPDTDNKARWFIFCAACNRLQSKLFRAGLPLRGAIDFGRFFVQDTFFAGHPIINAYGLCNMLELAACVLSEAAADQLRGLNVFGRGLDPYATEYLVPTKNGERHFFVTRAVVHERNLDIRQQVMNAFWGHRKDISVDVQKKATNTEQWLRYLDHLEEKKAAQ